MGTCKSNCYSKRPQHPPHFLLLPHISGQELRGVNNAAPQAPSLLPAFGHPESSPKEQSGKTYVKVLSLKGRMSCIDQLGNLVSNEGNKGNEGNATSYFPYKIKTVTPIPLHHLPTSFSLYKIRTHFQ